ncbi:hypothetical protein HAZT_HAZT004888 [Hyalella azteca]|uniref:Serpin domain-containing protein n=1 Tax=Hyalella azteca TaxID=294128 RepID=A0A6A0H816_HYAAZ|nr:hypothetical protein HAZT_HAZT004888 [Hyalella azteca]
MFGSSADLSGIGGLPGDLYVSNVLHKAFIDVNEEGTAVLGLKFARPMAITTFAADHPFFFLLGEKQKSGAVLICGRLLSA